jgi:hypothetical protein
MKKIAVLVIAATNQPVYIHYINNYWTALIRHLKAEWPHIDVYMLLERNTDPRPFQHIAENCIRDSDTDLDSLCARAFHTQMIPGVLSKTVHALALLQDKYDVFFRTNLSSMIRVPTFDRFVQQKERITYSGGLAWTNVLRTDLVNKGGVGIGKSVETLSELDSYPGNTFFGGSGFFLGAAEAKSLVQRRQQIRYDIIDDVSLGLMFREYEFLSDFTLIAQKGQSIAEIKQCIRRRDPAHLRLENFPLPKAREFWEETSDGRLWQVGAFISPATKTYDVHFPRFDHVEARSNEVRMTLEGLGAHPRVRLVDDPDEADLLVLCQNHLLEHNPRHHEFRQLKDRYRYKTVMVDFDDNQGFVIDREDFTWRLYFKRSCVDRAGNKTVDYGGLPVTPMSYCVLDDMVERPDGLPEERPTDVSCLFDDILTDSWVHCRGRGKLLEFAKSLQRKYLFTMQVGTVSADGAVGRSSINPRYKECLYSSRIVLHANPDPWEGDSRTWEAICSGALVFVDRMVQPIPHPLVDGQHVIFYDLTDAGLEALERQLVYYLGHEEERRRIAERGRAFVLERHRSIHRATEIIDTLDAQEDDLKEALFLSSRVVLDRETTFRLSNEATIEVIAGSNVVRHSGTGQGFICSASAAAFLALLDGKRNHARVLLEISDTYRVGWSRIAPDLGRLAVDLETRSIIERV